MRSRSDAAKRQPGELEELARTLIVNDVKTGANGKGAVALWLDAGTIAHFRNLRITPAE